jgi:predicted small lipoprotein YifL
VSLLTSRSLKIGVLALSLALVAAGCGRRGPLEAPTGGKAIPGEDNAQPETQSRETAPAVGNPIGQPQRRNEPIKPPTGPFVLDFLL